MSDIRKHKIIFEKCVKEDFYCSICSYPFLTKEDFTCKEIYNTCNECFLNFIESRKKEWIKGWRPKQNLIDSYIDDKKLLYKRIGDKSEL